MTGQFSAIVKMMARVRVIPHVRASFEQERREITFWVSTVVKQRQCCEVRSHRMGRLFER